MDTQNNKAFLQKKWKWDAKENNILRWIIIIVAVFLDFGLRFLPAPQGLSQDAFGLIGIFAGSLLLWLTIGIDWPSVLCLFALALLPKFGFSNTFNSSFGNSTFIFLLFTFVCTYAVSKTPIIKRIAIGFISNKFAKKNGWAFSICFLSAVLILGMFISPTVLFVVMMPILDEILKMSGIQKGEKAGKLLYIGTAFAVSISSGMTPIAHIFPILAISQAGLSIDYFSYMAFAIPVGIIVFALMLLMFKLFLKPDLSKLKNVDTNILNTQLSTISLQEILSSSIFIVVILLWLEQSFFCERGIATNQAITTSVYIILMVCTFVLWLVKLIKTAKNIKNEPKFALFLQIFVLFLIFALNLTFVILLCLNKFNVFVWLNNTQVAIFAMFNFLLFTSCLSVLLKGIKSKNKKIATSGIVLGGVGLVALILSLIFNNAFSSALKFVASLNNAMPAMFGAILLCLIKVDGKPLVNISDAFKNGVPWPSLVMCAGTLALGSALSSNTIGLKTFIQTNLQNSLSGVSNVVLLIIFIIWPLIQTNLSSNMVTATLVSSVAVSILSASSLNLGAVVSIIGMLSAYAFATPPSMPHIAITASSGYATTSDMFKYGCLLMLITAIATIAVGYPIASLILGGY